MSYHMGDEYDDDVEVMEAPIDWVPNFSNFLLSSYKGEAPPREDVVEGRICRGMLHILAAKGGVGKSQALLQLGMMISAGGGEFFGGRISQSCAGLPFMALFAEDGQRALHRRINVIQGQIGEPVAENFSCVIPTSNVDNSMHLVQKIPGMDIFEPTEAYWWLDRKLETLAAAFGGVSILILDTMSILMPMDANKRSEVQGAFNWLTKLASKHNVAVLLSTHLNKGNQPLREAISGSAGIVDAARVTLGMEIVGDSEAAELIHRELLEGSRLIRALDIKNNEGLRKSPIFWLQDKQTGYMTDITGEVSSEASDPIDALVSKVQELAGAGITACKTGNNGLHKHTSDTWPRCLQVSDRKIQQYVNRAVAEGRLIASAKGALTVPA